MDDKEFAMRLEEINHDARHAKEKASLTMHFALADLQMKLHSKEIDDQTWNIEHDRVVRDYQMTIVDIQQKRQRDLDDLQLERKRLTEDKEQK